MMTSEEICLRGANLGAAAPTVGAHFEASEGSRSSSKSPSSSSSLSRSAKFFVAALVIAVYLVHPAASCSSRSTPKPRPPSQGAIRPNITFQTYACPPAYAAWYCLNGATCFTVKIAESLLYNCECANGFMGQRCEFKDLEGSYKPTRERLFAALSAGGPNGRHVLFGAFGLIISFAVVSAIITRQRNKGRAHRRESSSIEGRSSISPSGTPVYLSESTTHVDNSPHRNYHQHCLRQIATASSMKQNKTSSVEKKKQSYEEEHCNVSIIGSEVSYSLQGGEYYSPNSSSSFTSTPPLTTNAEHYFRRASTHATSPGSGHQHYRRQSQAAAAVLGISM